MRQLTIYIFGLLLLTTSCGQVKSTTSSLSAHTTTKIDLTNLNFVKSTIMGQWFRIFMQDTIVETFRFSKNSFGGACKSKQYISSAPIFTLIRTEDNKTVIRWHNLTGGDFDYTILDLTAKKMTVQYSFEKTLVYFKK